MTFPPETMWYLALFVQLPAFGAAGSQTWIVY
jgi:hypothetical protein